ncbi:MULTISPECIES: hypothetical protein [unclassified Paraburkholderia]|uniref:hypothetical protein n=1 Tax=unclassified Paraburkholderia TaxID=2615204 RepID=UPI002AB17C1F|nr:MULTISPECIES: hypothetical protein [unclassified Paraburkholderia]
MTSSDMGSEKRADQASPFLCSWDVMVMGLERAGEKACRAAGRFKRSRKGRLSAARSGKVDDFTIGARRTLGRLARALLPERA